MIKIHLVHRHFSKNIFNIFKKSFQIDTSLYNYRSLFSPGIKNSPRVATQPMVHGTQAGHTYLYGEGIFGRLICNIKG